MVITTGTDDSGNGGTVLDDAVVIVGNLQNGTPVLSAMCAAMAWKFGVNDESGKELTPVRNLMYRMRKFGTEVLSEYAMQMSVKAAAEAAAASSNEVINAVKVI